MNIKNMNIRMLATFWALFLMGSAYSSCAHFPSIISAQSDRSSRGLSWSQPIDRVKGGRVEVTSRSSPLYGVKITIQPYGLKSDTTISIGEVVKPPPSPKEYNPVGVPIDLTPNGLVFSKPAKIEIPYSDEDLRDAGGSDAATIKVMSFDPASQNWESVKVLKIDTSQKIITAEVKHFSVLEVFLHTATPPLDLGRPMSGDLLYRASSWPGEDRWVPGHVVVYTGEKPYPGVGAASDAVKKFGVYNVIEAIPNQVQYSYYRVPNAVVTHTAIPSFDGEGTYMGARSPVSGSLSQEQRHHVINFAERQVGKQYSAILKAKGPNSFSCVGLAEKAYEVVGVNGGEGLIDASDEGVPTPPEQYNHTKPAGGENPTPHIKWAKITPNSGTECTIFKAEVAVAHNYSLRYIDSITYIQDNGMANPSIHINDQGKDGDRVAGDGIYSAMGAAGASYKMGSEGISFTASDVYGKTATTRVVYTFTGTCKKNKEKKEK